MKPKKQERIFSGRDSRKLWKAINKLAGKTEKPSAVFWAMYALGCRCQELEAVVRELERRIEELGG